MKIKLPPYRFQLACVEMNSKSDGVIATDVV
jgi:hypothetical protein